MAALTVGLDLGQAADFTSLVVIEGRCEAGESRYAVRHLERFRLGTPYPVIVAKVFMMMHTPELLGAPLVVDETGVGRPVVDMFSRMGRRCVPVTITAGNEATATPDGWHVPKRDLVGVVQVLLQSGRLQFVEKLPLAGTLARELTGFQVKIDPLTAHDSYGAWREGTHDDLVLALALACWHAERPPSLTHIFSTGKAHGWMPPAPTVLGYGSRKPRSRR